MNANKVIPPTDEKGRAKWERIADALLESAAPEEWERWPGFWPRQEETEFERIAAAHTGMVPLAATALVASLPGFDPEARRNAMRGLMQRPGAEAPDLISQMLDDTMNGTSYGSGFTMERRNFPPEVCRWVGCRESLYAPEQARTAGRPRKHCVEHQNAAKARTRRLRYAGIRLGKNRNLVYNFHGLEDQDLTGYREVWGRVNTVRV
ncbi:hypothetical protein ABZY02_19125 [Streptomyces sp. NPDC006649]|uniref:hypothetical protein n=1 Tax=unclassified Streptomyces TaxID=2593676 RepID=UPI0033B63CF8